MEVNVNKSITMGLFASAALLFGLGLTAMDSAEAEPLENGDKRLPPSLIADEPSPAGGCCPSVYALRCPDDNELFDYAVQCVGTCADSADDAADFCDQYCSATCVYAGFQHACC